MTDGTEAGTRLVKDVNPTRYGNVTNLQVVGGKLYFHGDNGTSGPELWVSDGTSGGTHLVGDLNLADADSDPEDFTLYRRPRVLHRAERRRDRPMGRGQRWLGEPLQGR